LNNNNNNGNLYASNNQLFQGTNQNKEPTNLQVNIIAGHHNWIAVAHPHFVTCYKMKDGIGWQLVSNHITSTHSYDFYYEPF
jgi:hypothetical protein